LTTPKEKGDALERAVRAIETTILQKAPAYSENTFTIESNKVVSVANVRHEIDIWVSVDLGRGYTALFIFECKNWIESVGKNEIIVFSEKIRAVQAQSGFFVAKSFTGDAEAQAALESRITLLRVADCPPETVPLPPFPFFHGVNIEDVQAQIEFAGVGAGEDGNRRPIDMATAVVAIPGSECIVQQYTHEWATRESDARVKSLFTPTTQEGQYELGFESERTFAPGEARLDGKRDRARSAGRSSPSDRLPGKGHFVLRGRVQGEGNDSQPRCGKGPHEY
jgi:hypothetical protein